MKKKLIVVLMILSSHVVLADKIEDYQHKLNQYNQAISESIENVASTLVLLTFTSKLLTSQSQSNISEVSSLFEINKNGITELKVAKSINKTMNDIMRGKISDPNVALDLVVDNLVQLEKANLAINSQVANQSYTTNIVNQSLFKEKEICSMENYSNFMGYINYQGDSVVNFSSFQQDFSFGINLNFNNSNDVSIDFMGHIDEEDDDGQIYMWSLLGGALGASAINYFTVKGATVLGSLSSFSPLYASGIMAGIYITYLIIKITEMNKSLNSLKNTQYKVFKAMDLQERIRKLYFQKCHSFSDTYQSVFKKADILKKDDGDNVNKEAKVKLIKDDLSKMNRTDFTCLESGLEMINNFEMFSYCFEKKILENVLSQYENEKYLDRSSEVFSKQYYSLRKLLIHISTSYVSSFRFSQLEATKEGFFKLINTTRKVFNFKQYFISNLEKIFRLGDSLESRVLISMLEQDLANFKLKNSQLTVEQVNILKAFSESLSLLKEGLHDDS